MRKIQIATLALFFVLVTSCCPCRKAVNNTHSPLLATEWSLVQMDGRNITESFAEEGCPQLILGEDGNFGGYGGCNSMGGAYTLTPSESPAQKNTSGVVAFANIFSTKRMCPNDRLEMEFFKTLSECDSYTIEGSKLFLFKDGVLMLVFEAKTK
ncbi:MAG: META domain-containing protein [Tidjanibacter sp.]|nr:META domain-containing protein [Tidjanibacter sp.]